MMRMYFLQNLLFLCSYVHFKKRKIINSPSNAYVKEALAFSYCKPLMKRLNFELVDQYAHRKLEKRLLDPISYESNLIYFSLFILQR